MTARHRTPMASIPPPPGGDAPLRWLGRAFQAATLAGLAVFGLYILLRASGATPQNFAQWDTLVAGQPIRSTSEWIANLGIGLHFAMGAILVLAWPILFSSAVRARHRAVHRWTGRVYVGAGLLAGIGGLSFILTHGAYAPPASVAFAIWGSLMMACAVMAYVHARARRFDRHRAWSDLTGGAGMGEGNAFGPFDYAILYLFFVPNLLVAEFFIRNGHRRLVLPRHLRWPVVAALATAGLVFAYAIAVVTATPGGKFGKHLLQLATG